MTILHDDGARPQRRRRDAYAECGCAGRQAIARAHAARVTAPDLRVLNAVLSLTVLYSKLSDRVSVRQVAAIAYVVERDDLAEWQRRKTGDSLRMFHKLGVFVWQSGKGRASRSYVAIPPAIDPAEGSIEGGTETPPGAGERPRRGQVKDPAEAATPSSNSEKSSPRGREREQQQESEAGAARALSLGEWERFGSRTDALKLRCIRVFPKCEPDDCCRVIDELRQHYDDSLVIDVALGKCEEEGAYSLNYLRNKCRMLRPGRAA